MMTMTTETTTNATTTTTTTTTMTMTMAATTTPTKRGGGDFACVASGASTSTSEHARRVAADDDNDGDDDDDRYEHVERQYALASECRRAGGARARFAPDGGFWRFSSAPSTRRCLALRRCSRSLSRACACACAQWLLACMATHPLTALRPPSPRRRRRCLRVSPPTRRRADASRRAAEVAGKRVLRSRAPTRR